MKNAETANCSSSLATEPDAIPIATHDPERLYEFAMDGSSTLYRDVRIGSRLDERDPCNGSVILARDLLPRGLEK